MLVYNAASAHFFFGLHSGIQMLKKISVHLNESFSFQMLSFYCENFLTVGALPCCFVANSTHPRHKKKSFC